MIRKLMTSAALALVMYGSSGAAFAATPADMLVIGTSIPRTFDPADINARVASELVTNAYDTLVMTTPGDIATLKPMLATQWTVSADGKLLTFTLREGVTFQSGNPLTAEDAAWSLRRVIKMGRVGSTDFAPWGFTAETVDSLIRAVDAKTLEIELPEPVNTDLVLLSLAGASLGIIDSKLALEHQADGDLGAAWLAANTAGSGPFHLTQWRPNEIALFDARPDYWDGAPAMKRVAIRNIPESGNLRLQVEAGDLDIAQNVAAGDLDALETNDAVVIQNVPGLGYYYIALNQKDPDLSKPLVREAFQHAFDWQAIEGNMMKHVGSAWQSVIPKGMIGAPEAATDRYDYDPEKARALLAEAGYPNGLKKVLNPAGAGVLTSMAEALQASARAAGIELELVPGEFTNAFRERNFEVLTGNSGARLADPFAVATQYAYNPDNSDEAKLSGLYMWRVAQENAETTALVTQSKSELDGAKRAEIFSKIDALYKEMDPGMIVFFQRSDPYVLRANVKGYEGHPTWSTRWHDVTKD